VREVIIEKFSGAHICVGIIWMNVLPGDSEEAAKDAAWKLNSPFVTHFYDPHKLSGKAIAESIGWGDTLAWDIYLFYKAGVAWGQRAPVPASYMHQLSKNRTDPEHFYKGEDLVKKLSETAERLIDVQGQRV
jgi:hypothetical protein